MSARRARLAGVGAVVAGCAAASADTVIVPQNAASTGGSGGYSTILNSGARSWLTVIGSAELNGRLPVGASINGVSWRLMSFQSLANWPTQVATFTNFDIYLGQAALPPGTLDLSVASNNWGPDLTLVRSGAAVFSVGYFQGGALSPAFNPFCATINFPTPYTYHGGDLLIMVRHTGCGVGSTFLDWVSSSFGTAGAQGISVASYSSNTGWGGGGTGGAVAMQFTYDAPSTCYANCDGSTATPVLNVADFTCFLTKYAANETYANCDGSTATPTLNVADFTCFLTKFAGGCL